MRALPGSRPGSGSYAVSLLLNARLLGATWDLYSVADP